MAWNAFCTKKFKRFYFANQNRLDRFYRDRHLKFLNDHRRQELTMYQLLSQITLTTKYCYSRGVNVVWGRQKLCQIVYLHLIFPSFEKKNTNKQCFYEEKWFQSWANLVKQNLSMVDRNMEVVKVMTKFTFWI